MAIKIVGMEVKQGNYQGHDYKNCNLFCITDRQPEGEHYGSQMVELKVKYETLVQIAASYKLQVPDLLNHVIEPTAGTDGIFYDKYSRICGLNIK